MTRRTNAIEAALSALLAHISTAPVLFRAPKAEWQRRKSTVLPGVRRPLCLTPALWWDFVLDGTTGDAVVAAYPRLRSIVAPHEDLGVAYLTGCDAALRSLGYRDSGESPLYVTLMAFPKESCGRLVLRCHACPTLWVATKKEADAFDVERSLRVVIPDTALREYVRVIIARVLKTEQQLGAAQQVTDIRSTFHAARYAAAAKDSQLQKMLAEVEQRRNHISREAVAALICPPDSDPEVFERIRAELLA